MTWSFRIARIAGTDVKVHFTFLLLVAWWAMSGYQEGGTPGAVHATVLLLSLFTCVLLHEFGHILMARRFGVRTPDVILLPIGGVARLERIPDKPKEELLIALAGPFVTLVLAAVFYGWLVLTGQSITTTSNDLAHAPLAVALLVMNVILLVFNLIPAFPMDGGRVLRALLASKLGFVRATRIAATIGQGLAIPAGVYGLFKPEPMLVLIALFVFLGAATEAAAVETRMAGEGIRIEQMMVTRFETIPVHARLRLAVDLLLSGEQREFPVVDNAGRVEGILTRESLIKALAERGPESTVGEAMISPVPALPLGLDFEAAVGRLRSSGLAALPVVGPSGELVGLLTMDNVSDLIMVRRAVSKR
jgi:Zn-dependent protease/CBS domain-containing protein